MDLIIVIRSMVIKNVIKHMYYYGFRNTPFRGNTLRDVGPTAGRTVIRKKKPVSNTQVKRVIYGTSYFLEL
jgi:hypothetical protein